MVLEVSFIGMKKQTVQVDATRRKTVEITLVDDVKTLEDVVVTGYSNVRKSSFTGSSTQISGDDLRKVSQTNIIGAIQSFDPSFRLVDNVQFGSDPNALPEMYIRGRSGFGVKELDKDQLSKSNLENNPNLPTFIMDGFEVSIEKVYDLDPTRIESLTVLKDAAATAMYGSRAANGVVVITTVAPKAGEVRVSYNFTGTLEMPDLRDYNLANASEKLEIERLAGLFDKGQANIPSTAVGMNNYYKKYALIQKGVDTDWMSIPLQNSFNHKHSIYLEGGTPNLRYGVDGSFNIADGVMKGTERNRYSAGFSLDYRIKNLQVRNYVSFGHTKSKESPYGSFSDFSGLQPYDSPYKDDGTLREKLTYSKISGRDNNNPLYEATLGNYNWNSYDEVIDNLSFNWYLNDYWTVKGQFSVTKKYSKSEKFIDPLSSKTSVTGSKDNNLAGDLYTTNGESLDWNSNAFLYYTRSFNKQHNLNVSAGWEAASGTTESTNAHYRGFPSGEFHSLNYAAEVYKKPTRTENTTRRVSVLASANYTWNDIYLVDASVRFDGSSEFGANQKWAPFFSGGLGVNIHNYDFFKSNGYINKLKLRASYGRTGKVNFPAYAATTMYETLFDEWYITGYGAVLKALGNKDLTWEKSKNLNIGLEAAFLNNRLKLETEYFLKKTSDMLYNMPYPISSGISYVPMNLLDMQNKGIEFTISATPIQTKDFIWNLSFNGTHYSNKILNLPEDKRENGIIHGTASLFRLMEGGSIYDLYTYEYAGVNPETGAAQWYMDEKDANGKVTGRTVTEDYTQASKYELGSTLPDFQGGFSTDFAYKGIDLSIATNFQIGGKIYDSMYSSFMHAGSNIGSNWHKDILNAWTPENKNTNVPIMDGAQNSNSQSSRFLINASFFNIRNISLGYTFPKEWMKAISASSARIYVSADNVALFSKRKGMDPRQYAYGYSAANYSAIRTLSFGINLNF